MNLINLSLEFVYCSNLVSNYVLIRLIRFVSQFTDEIFNQFCDQSIFNISNIEDFFLKMQKRKMQSELSTPLPLDTKTVTYILHECFIFPMNGGRKLCFFLGQAENSACSGRHLHADDFLFFNAQSFNYKMQYLNSRTNSHHHTHAHTHTRCA